MLPALKITGLALATLILGGCSVMEHRVAVDESAHRANDSVMSHRAAFQQVAQDAHRTLGQQVELPWVAGKVQPLAREVTLPRALRANVNTTLLFAGGATDLLTLAERIHNASGIPVRVEPDALLPRNLFLPRLSVQGDIATSDTADTLLHAITGPSLDRHSGPSVPGLIPAGQTTEASSDAALRTVSLPPGQAPLPNVLDAISLRLGVYWRYDPGVAAIIVYRTETRQFNVRAMELTAQTELELGLSGGSSASSGAGGGNFASRSKSRFEADKRSVLEAVTAKLEQFLTRAGRVVAPDGASNIVVVTDTRDALDAVAKYLEAENRALSRRVRLVVEEVTLSETDANNAGIDWNLLFTSGGQGNEASLSGLGTLLNTVNQAADLGVTVGSGQWAGSAVSVKALSQLGKVVRRTSVPVLTLNRRPVTYAVRETFSYIEDLEQTQSTSDSSAPTVTVTQKEETVGTFLTLVPDAQADGQVLLTLAYDDTKLVALEKQPLGQDGSFVQQPRITGQGVTQQVELRPGQPMVVAGFAQEDDSYTHRRLDRSAPMLLGGSDATQTERLYTVLLVTALPEEGF